MKASLAIAANAIWLLAQTGPAYAYSQEEVNLFESQAPQATPLSARQQAGPTGAPNVESSYGGMPASRSQSGGQPPLRPTCSSRQTCDIFSGH